MFTTETIEIDVRRHLGLAHSVSRRFVQPGDNVRDSEQYADACLQLVEAARDYRPEDGEFSPFAWRKMTNALIESCRFRGRKKRSGKFAEANLDIVQDRPHEVPVPVSELIYTLLSDAADETKEDKTDKLLLVEVYLGGNKVVDVAKRLNVSREWIYQRLRRAVVRIRSRHPDIIHQYGDDE